MTELSNLCGLAQVRAVKKSCHAALVFSHVGTHSHPPSFRVALMVLGGALSPDLSPLGGALGPDLSPVTPRPFAWQAWYLVTSTFISRGRRGTNLHPPSFCVAGVALMGLGGALGPDLSPVTPRPFAWLAWHLVTSMFVSRDRRGTISHPRSFCVAWHHL